jgi:hypothetical protein
MKTRQELTTAQRGWLEHLRRAEAQDVSLVDYARAAGIKVGSLYEARRMLRSKGVVARGPSSAIAPSPPQQFIPVQVIAAASNRMETKRTEPVCRLRHPETGWVIECSGYPELSWVRGLLESQP